MLYYSYFTVSSERWWLEVVIAFRSVQTICKMQSKRSAKGCPQPRGCCAQISRHLQVFHWSESRWNNRHHKIHFVKSIPLIFLTHWTCSHRQKTRQFTTIGPLWLDIHTHKLPVETICIMNKITNFVVQSNWFEHENLASLFHKCKNWAKRRGMFPTKASALPALTSN